MQVLDAILELFLSLANRAQSGTDAINLTFHDEISTHWQSFISILALSLKNVCVPFSTLQTPPTNTTRR